MTTSLFNSGVRPAIDQWLLDEAAKKRDYGEYWSASSAGYCMRRLIFERLGVPKIESEQDGRKQRVFTSGHLFHEWIQGITEKAGISIAQELELQDEDLMVRGHFDDLVLVPEPSANIKPDVVPGMEDGFIETKPQPQVINFITLPSKLILYDYKTRNSRSFNFAKSPSQYHKMQLGTYMYMLRKTKLVDLPAGVVAAPGIVEEARTLNIEKDTLRMAEVQYLWTPELEKEVVGYWTELNKHWAARTLPKCTCADHENGFLAREAYNGYFYEGEPCSIEWMNKTKSEGLWQHPDAKK